jgi:hypothetical protein
LPSWLYCLAGKETDKFWSNVVKFRPVLTSVVKPGQGREFFFGQNGKETVKFFFRHQDSVPQPSTPGQSGSDPSTSRVAPCCTSCSTCVAL